MITHGTRNLSPFSDHIYFIKKGMERKPRTKGDSTFLARHSIAMYFAKVKLFHIFKVSFYVVYLKRYRTESIRWLQQFFVLSGGMKVYKILRNII